MQAPVGKDVKIKTPSGTTLSTTTVRTVALADPANPLSLASLTETLKVGSHTYTSVYDAATRTVTETSPGDRRTTASIDAQGRVTGRTTTGTTL